MAARSPIRDAEFRLIDHKVRLQPADLLVYLVWVGCFAAAAYASADRRVHVIAVLAAGAVLPVKRWLGQLTHKVSPEQVDMMRLRLDARQPWRKRAISRR